MGFAESASSSCCSRSFPSWRKARCWRERTLTLAMVTLGGVIHPAVHNSPFSVYFDPLFNLSMAEDGTRI